MNAALTLSRRIGALARSADAIYWLNDAAILRSEFELAAARAAEAESIYAQLGHEDGRAWMHACRAASAQCDGQFDKAATLVEESLLLFRPNDNGINVAMTHTILGEARFGQGAFEQAEAEYRRSLTMVREQASYEIKFAISWNLAALAQLAAARRQFERAARLIGARTGVRGEVQMFVFPNERAEVEQAERWSRTALGEDGFAAALMAGRGLSLTEAIDYALDVS